MFIMNCFRGQWEVMFLIICLSSDLCSLCCVSGVPLPAECVVERTGVTQVSQRAAAGSVQPRETDADTEGV